MSDLGRQKAQRIERKREKLKDYGPVRCQICGRNDPRGLELHHTFGRANSDEQIILCGYCHSVVSDSQQDWPDGVLEHGEKSGAETLCAALAGLADLVETFAEYLVRLLRGLVAFLQERREEILLPVLPRLLAGQTP